MVFYIINLCVDISNKLKFTILETFIIDPKYCQTKSFSDCKLSTENEPINIVKFNFFKYYFSNSHIRIISIGN